MSFVSGWSVGVSIFAMAAVLFSQLVDRCFRICVNPSNPTAETAQSKLLKISWQVITNTTAEVPFDFCVSNVRALLK
jgi:hypothetical protein